MKENLENTYLTDRKTSLQAIKDYVLSLLKKRKQQTNDETTKQLQDTLESNTKKELEEKQTESRIDKIKKKTQELFDADEKQEQNKSDIYINNSLKFPPEDKDEYLPQDMEVGETSGEQSHF
jgi:hypothetical protein